MLTLTTRRLTAAEREALATERARMLAEDAEYRSRPGVGRLYLATGLLTLVGAVSLLHPHGSWIVTAVAVAIGADLVKKIRDRRDLDRLCDLAGSRRFKRLEAAIATDEVRELEIRADAAVTVYDADARDPHDDPVVDGYLLRIGPDQIVYLPVALARGVERERLPNTHLRITSSPGLEIQQAEAHGERIEPLAAVVPTEQDVVLTTNDMLTVWSPSTDTYEDYRPCEPEVRAASWGRFERLAAPLWTGPYR